MQLKNSKILLAIETKTKEVDLVKLSFKLVWVQYSELSTFELNREQHTLNEYRINGSVVA